MKFRSYQAQGQIGPSATGISNFRYSNPGAVAAAKESGNTGVVFGQGVLGVVDRVNTVKAMEANNYYNKRMSEESADLINNHKEGEALNITELYDEAHQKVMDETMSKYGNFIRYGKAGDDFRDYTERDNISRRNNMQKYQMVETEKYEESVFQNQIAQSQQIAVTGNYSAESMSESINRNEALIRQRYGQYGEERVQQEIRKYTGKFAKDGIDYMVGRGEYDVAKVMLEQYSDYLSPELNNLYGAAIYEKQRKQDFKNEAEELYAIYGNNVEGAMAEYDRRHSADVGSGDADSSFESFIAKIGMQESGGNYDAVNSSSGARGKYQIMPGNWPSWSQEAGLPAGSEMTPENQEIVARFKLKQYYEQYGAKGALVAWYAGPDNADRYVQGESTDVWGRAWTAPQSDGPSIQGYVDEALAQNVGGSSSSGGNLKKAQDREDFNKFYLGVASEKERVKNMRIDYKAEQYRPQIRNMHASGLSGYTIYESLTQGLPLDDSETRDAIKAACSREGLSTAQPSPRGSGGSGGSGGRRSSRLTEGQWEDIKAQLKEGNIPSLNSLINDMVDHGYNNKTDLDKAEGLWKDLNEQKGEFKFDLSGCADEAISGFNLQGERKKTIRKGMIAYGSVWINDYRRQNNGEDPSEAEVIEAMEQANAAPVYGGAMYTREGNWFKEVFSATPAELASAGILSVAPYPYDDGVIRDNNFIVSYIDGRPSEHHTGDEIDRMIGR